MNRGSVRGNKVPCIGNGWVDVVFETTLNTRDELPEKIYLVLLVGIDFPDLKDVSVYDKL